MANANLPHERPTSLRAIASSERIISAAIVLVTVSVVPWVNVAVLQIAKTILTPSLHVLLVDQAIELIGALCCGLLIAFIAQHLSRGIVGPAAALALGCLPVCFLAPTVVLWPATLRCIERGSFEEIAAQVAGVMTLGALGLIVSVPIGALFFAVFASSFVPFRKHLAAPSVAITSHAARLAARMILVAVPLALVTAGSSEARYCATLLVVVCRDLQIVVPGGADIAWTRFAVAIAPLVPFALIFWGWARISEFLLARRLRRISEGSDPKWELEERSISPSEAFGVLPVRPSDRTESVRLIRQRGSEYRSHPTYFGYVAA